METDEEATTKHTKGLKGIEARVVKSKNVCH